jgi:hypothetical protein
MLVPLRFRTHCTVFHDTTRAQNSNSDLPIVSSRVKSLLLQYEDALRDRYLNKSLTTPRKSPLAAFSVAFTDLDTLQSASQQGC